jgi:hypothetical protein
MSRLPPDRLLGRLVDRMKRMTPARKAAGGAMLFRQYGLLPASLDEAFGGAPRRGAT